MRYALLMVFAMLFAGIQSIHAQSCCAKGQAGKTAAASMEKGCTGMAKASATTTPEASGHRFGRQCQHHHHNHAYGLHR